MSYEFLDHTADVIIHAKGKNLNEAFAQGAMGFFDVITDVSLIENAFTKKIKIESEDYESLLFDWIAELIFIFDTELFVSNDIQVTTLVKNEQDKFVLEAELKGEKFDLTKHPQDSDVKAMTYSFMKIGKDFIEFTLDL
ncbi:MAG: archease [Candidatus Heimdallarchaeota archaeon]